MKTVIIVQARMTSTRLPGKVLKKVMGKMLLEYQIERLKRISLADEIVIATTVNDTDQPIVDLCTRLSIDCFRGSEEDVLARYYGAAMEHYADVVVRVTSDCPIIDPKLANQVIQNYLDNQDKLDYLGIDHYPRGLDVEVFAFRSLKQAFLEATMKPDREHVTPYLYRHPTLFRIQRMVSTVDYSQYRWTVDTQDDLKLITKILEKLYITNPEFGMQEVLKLLGEYPQWNDINAHVRQKHYGD